jgi:hypothetical protein
MGPDGFELAWPEHRATTAQAGSNRLSWSAGGAEQGDGREQYEAAAGQNGHYCSGFLSVWEARAATGKHVGVLGEVARHGLKFRGRELLQDAVGDAVANAQEHIVGVWIDDELGVGWLQLARGRRGDVIGHDNVMLARARPSVQRTVQGDDPGLGIPGLNRLRRGARAGWLDPYLIEV